MRRVGIVSVCVAVLLATAAFGAGDAWAEAPEFGRCVKVAKGTGAYATANCTSLGGERKFEWLPGPGANNKFTTKLKEATLVTVETVAGTKLVCTGETSTGEFSSASSVNAVDITFTGCESGSLKCGSSGAKSGEVVWNSLNGQLGVYKKGETPLQNRVALDLGPVGFEFSCAGLPVRVRGSVLQSVRTNAMVLTSTIRFLQKKGHQSPEAFEGGEKDVLEWSFGGGPFEQAGLSLSALQTNEEKLEVNTVV